MCEDEDNFRAIEMPPADPMIEMPLSGSNILNVPLEKDLHVLSDMVSDERLNMAMKDATCLDFGYLDKDLHFMLMCDEDVSLDLERLHINAEEDILERTSNVTITEEIEEQQLSQEIHSPMLVDIFSNLTERLPLTPQKRATKEPRETQVETPTKRRRLSFEGATMTEPPGPVEDVTRQADIELESVHSSYFVVHPADVSTLKRTDIAIAEPIDSTTNILPDAIHEMDVDVPMVPEVVHDMITLEGTGIGPRPHQENSNIADTSESFEDIEKYLLKKQQPVLQVQHIPASPAISRGSSQPQLTSQELYALLQVSWCDKEFVKFGNLIPNETYTKRDAATAFGILLGVKKCFLTKRTKTFKITVILSIFTNIKKYAFFNRKYRNKSCRDLNYLLYEIKMIVVCFIGFVPLQLQYTFDLN
ncbi:PREDICTED: uncharacterized protein LOC105566109 [Vollenhovia emeryi]|uniref:uncharacterized protein LOC105566109 n=1 Tax=Vollenhovia emeryi TaxID=411798 RepID=UPI0005F3CB85|nr:PREDICTED: uncharacterized protein LOC105566109 [Vollenhovia emeryi]